MFGEGGVWINTGVEYKTKSNCVSQKGIRFFFL